MIITPNNILCTLTYIFTLIILLHCPTLAVKRVWHVKMVV